MFGPFINRNHFAGWMVMALPIVVGYSCGVVGSLRLPQRRGVSDWLHWAAWPPVPLRPPVWLGEEPSLAGDGGASSLHLQAPAATQVRIEIDAGSSSLRVNGSRSSAFGSGLSYESDGYSGGADRYQLSASGGAADLSWNS